MNAASGRAKMSGHYIHARLRLASFARQMAAFSLVLLIVTIVFHRLDAIVPQALFGLLLLVAFLAGLAALIALGGLLKAWRKGARGGGRAVGALLIAGVVLAPFAFAIWLAVENPPVNIAATQGFDETGAQLGAAAAAAATAEPDAAPTASGISGRRFEASAPQVYGAARIVLADNGWEVIDVVAGDPTPDYPENGDLGVSGTVDIPLPTPRSSIDLTISADPLERPDSDRYLVEAVARDLVFALPSDVTIRIIEEGGSTFVDLRSASRATAFDLGQNRRFIEGFLADLDEAMAGSEAVLPAT